MYIQSSAILACALILSLLFIQCGGTYRSTELKSAPLEDTTYVIYKNIDLKYSVGVVDVGSDLVNNLVRARLRLKNLTGKHLNVELKIKFRDSQGYELKESAWIPFPMDSGEIKSFEQIASDPLATDFRIIIQRAGSHRSGGGWSFDFVVKYI